MDSAWVDCLDQIPSHHDWGELTDNQNLKSSSTKPT